MAARSRLCDWVTYTHSWLPTLGRSEAKLLLWSEGWKPGTKSWSSLFVRARQHGISVEQCRQAGPWIIGMHVMAGRANLCHLLLLWYRLICTWTVVVMWKRDTRDPIGESHSIVLTASISAHLCYMRFLIILSTFIERFCIFLHVDRPANVPFGTTHGLHSSPTVVRSFCSRLLPILSVPSWYYLFIVFPLASCGCFCLTLNI